MDVLHGLYCDRWMMRVPWGGEAFSRIAPAIPLISDVIINDNLFEVLTASTGGRLQFSVYEKYLNGLERLAFS